MICSSSKSSSALATILSHIKSSSAYLQESAAIARYVCPNDAIYLADLDSQYPLEELIRNWRSLVADFSALESYLEAHNV